MEDPSDEPIDFVSPCGLFTLTLDDDGKVAYAYLKRGGTICGDVWLYNRCPTPTLPEWKDRSNMPFANCRDYMHAEGHLETGVAFEEVRVAWEYPDGAATACVSIRDRLVDYNK